MTLTHSVEHQSPFEGLRSAHPGRRAAIPVAPAAFDGSGPGRHKLARARV